MGKVSNGTNPKRNSKEETKERRTNKKNIRTRICTQNNKQTNSVKKLKPLEALGNLGWKFNMNNLIENFTYKCLLHD